MSERALVLGGGGSAGNAWLVGVVAGLADAGTDSTAADRVIGTSAGATAAVQVTGAQPGALLAEILSTEVPRRPPVPAEGNPDRTPHRPAVDHLERTGRIIAAASDAADMRRRMGAAALERDAADPGKPRWRDVVASRLPSQQWPRQRVLITAVDAHTGEPVVFDRHSGIDLVDAVAASTSALTPYRIGEKRYLNGGYRRSENADLAMGFGRVVVLSPFSGRTRMPLEWGMDLATQVDELRAVGSRVEAVFPDSGAGDVFDANALDPSTRRQAARGGYEQGQALAERLADFWS